MARAGRPGRPKGLPKTGGRKAGTPNKRTEDLVERLKQAMGEDWCPIVAMARIAGDPETSLDMRVRCLSEVAPYVQPKRRAIEHGVQTSLEELVQLSLADQLKAARERVAAGIAANLKRPTIQIVTGVPTPAEQVATVSAVAPLDAEAGPAPTPPPAPPPPRLTAITDMPPQPPEEFDPYQ